MHVDIIERMELCPSFTTAKYETMMKTLEYIDEKYVYNCSLTSFYI